MENISLLGALEPGLITLIVILSIIVLIGIIMLCFVPIGIWFRALVSGSHISMGRLIGMRLRKVKVYEIVIAYISAKKAGLNIEIDELETHYMAGGDVNRVVKALISAHSADINLTNQVAKAIDLAGRDVYGAIKTSVLPDIIETPFISAIAKNGVELKVKAKVTVKSNINQIIGGADSGTIIACVGEGIVTTVGSAISHEVVLENPDLISKTVLSKGLDAGTAFEILSIDIADIDVGRNIGAQLLIDQATADSRVAQAKAEERKSMAIALEQEMRAKTQEMRANVVAAESEIPKAIARALASGKLGLMDYYNMENIQADTLMRESIGGNPDNVSPTSVSGNTKKRRF